jgi:hypothetical protein
MSNLLKNRPDWRTEDYDQFKTGLNYFEVWQALRQEKEAGKRSHITRHTVLGKWHEMKMSMYEALREVYGVDEEVPF